MTVEGLHIANIIRENLTAMNVEVLRFATIIL